jgi:hypothetical protein
MLEFKMINYNDFIYDLKTHRGHQGPKKIKYYIDTLIGSRRVTRVPKTQAPQPVVQI